MIYLLDTNVLSELIRKHPSPAVLQRVRNTQPGELRTAAICVMELRFGASRHPHGEALWSRIRETIIRPIGVEPFDRESAVIAGEILADLEKKGERIGVEDVQIAATAIRYEMVVVTRNVRHLSRIPELNVENWW